MCASGMRRRRELRRLTSLPRRTPNNSLERGACCTPVPAELGMSTDLAIGVNDLDFAYAQLHGVAPRRVLHDVTLNLPKGSRCLLVGSNGAGESLSLCTYPLPSLSRRADSKFVPPTCSCRSPSDPCRQIDSAPDPRREASHAQQRPSPRPGRLLPDPTRSHLPRSALSFRPPPPSVCDVRPVRQDMVLTPTRAQWRRHRMGRQPRRPERSRGGTFPVSQSSEREGSANRRHTRSRQRADGTVIL